MSQKAPCRHSYYQNFEGGLDDTYSVLLHQSEDAYPPSRATPSVKYLGKIDCKLDIASAPIYDWVSPGGKRLKRMDFEVEMIPSGASVKFILYIGGRRQGEQKVNLVFQ